MVLKIARKTMREIIDEKIKTWEVVVVPHRLAVSADQTLSDRRRPSGSANRGRTNDDGRSDEVGWRDISPDK